MIKRIKKLSVFTILFSILLTFIMPSSSTYAAPKESYTNSTVEKILEDNQIESQDVNAILVSDEGDIYKVDSIKAMKKPIDIVDENTTNSVNSFNSYDYNTNNIEKNAATYEVLINSSTLTP